MKPRIAILYGGRSSEHDVSVMGYEYMSELLCDTDYEILPVYIRKDGAWLAGGIPAFLTYLRGGGLYVDGNFIKIDVAIPLLHGDGGEDGSVQGALCAAGIPYVGADASASAVCLDKFYTKCVVSSLGIPTLDCMAFSSPSEAAGALDTCRRKIGFPLFVKPRRLGSSVGAYPVVNESSFKRLFNLSSKVGKNLVIAERMLSDKRELECAFCEIGGRKIVTAPGEILIDGFYGYGEKYGGKTQTAAVADVDLCISEKIREYALSIASALSLRHLARIDFFLSDDGIFFNEVNTFPGFTRESLYPKMLYAAGIDPRDALLSFVNDALTC